jgi:hypothetical protein
VLAAAGLVALEQMTERLAEDHANARLLATAAAEAHPDGVDLDQVETNIVYLEGVDAAAVVAALAESPTSSTTPGWLTCRRGASPPTPRGSPSSAWPTTSPAGPRAPPASAGSPPRPCG